MMNELELIPIENEEKPTNVFLALRMGHIVNGQPCSLRKLSKLMNGAVGYSHISQLENGKVPSLSELIAYSDYFHVSIDYLLGREESPSGCMDSVANNSFNELVTSLYLSKNSADRQMLDTLNYLISSNSGRALLFYLSEFVSCDDKDSYESIFQALKAWKKISGKGVLSYQEIMLSISNLLEL